MLVLLGGTMGAGAPAAPAAVSAQVRIGSAPVTPPGTKLLEGVAAVRRLRLTITLWPRDPTALAGYAAAVSQPGSSSFRRYLSRAQFRRRFAPTAASVAKVERSLRRHHLRVGSLTANGLALHVSGTGAQIQQAFSTPLAEVRLRGGRDALINTEAPAVDASIGADVQAIIGLNGVPHMLALLAVHRARTSGARPAARRVARVATGGPQPCAAAAQIAPGQGAYTADQIASAYGFTGAYQSGDFGQGVTIAAYELEPDLPSDIADYQKCYGTHAQVSYVKVDGGAGTGAGQGEAALDIEQLIGLAPKASILVYQGPNSNSDNPGTGPYDTLAQIVSQDRAQVISNSWGECEKLEGLSAAQAEDTLLQEAAVQGQSFVSAAGDSGSEDCWGPPPGGSQDSSLAVDDPGSQPFATDVGGTSFLTSQATAPTELTPTTPQTVWNDDNPSVDYARFGIQPGAGGGGISTFWPMPVYQSAAAASVNLVSALSSGAPCAAASGSYCRETPDVSADADPMTAYLDYWNGTGTKSNAETGWQGTGGTSGAAPVWAAVFALADASRACAGEPVGFANGELYALAGQSYGTYFSDVTAGNNDFTPSGNASGMFPAGVGYDMATGLGTPNAYALVQGLCQQTVHVTNPGTLHSFYSQPIRLQVAAALPAGQTGQVSFSAKYLPAGLHLDAATGTISGRPRVVGVRRVLLTALSSLGTYGTVRFSWVTDRRPHLRVLTSKSPAAYVLAISAGSREPQVRGVTVTLPATVRLASSTAARVLTRAGTGVPRNASLRGRTLTLTLRRAHSFIYVLLLRSALHVVKAGPLKVVVTDNAGGSTTFTRAL
ncbi:MAG: S53 family peptidase [Solirubrobacteraceae bacterium]